MLLATFGPCSAALALVYALFLSGLIAATFIDFEHFIIPDEITIGGMVAGFACSFFWPALQGQASPAGGLRQSLLGMGAGAGIIYLILRGGKLLFGRQRVTLPAHTRVVFGESGVHLPDREIPYDELFYRRSDVITLYARTLELADRGYKDVRVRLAPDRLQIGEEELNPEEVPHLEAVCTEIVFPVKPWSGDVSSWRHRRRFDAAWSFLMVSSMIAPGLAFLILLRKEWSRTRHGPYIALAVTA